MILRVLPLSTGINLKWGGGLAVQALKNFNGFDDHVFSVRRNDHTQRLP